MTTRTIVRRTLAVIVLVTAVCGLIAIRLGTPGAPVMAIGAAIALLLLARAVRITSRHS